MRSIFWGIFFVLFNYYYTWAIEFSDHTVRYASMDLLPNVLGYILITIGCMQLAKYSQYFTYIRVPAIALSILTAAGCICGVYGLTMQYPRFFSFVSFLLNLCLIIVLFFLIMALRDMLKQSDSGKKPTCLFVTLAINAVFIFFSSAIFRFVMSFSPVEDYHLHGTEVVLPSYYSTLSIIIFLGIPNLVRLIFMVCLHLSIKHIGDFRDPSFNENTPASVTQ